VPLKFQDIDLTDAPARPVGDWPLLRMPAAYEQGLVSVIIPTYNRATFLAEAIDSVWNQTYRPVELLLIDDGSTDNTTEVIREKFARLPNEAVFSAYYIREPNRGASSARNQGLLHSHGEFIQYLDSDDVLVRHKLARHVAALRSNEKLDLVWSDWLVVPSEMLQVRLTEANTKAMAAEESACQPTDRIIPWEPWPILARRRFVSAHPLWNELTSRWDDWEYTLRLLAANPIRAFVGGVCCIQREHSRGRRHDYDFNPEGVEKGLIALRAAAQARGGDAKLNPSLDQLVASCFWELFLESLLCGTNEQADEAILGAVKYGRRLPFRIKTLITRSVLIALGVKTTLALLR
jgi:glycosyltransferase involved in cell wall biosynthesis